MDEAANSAAVKALAQCRALGFILATAESCTGGLISAALTSVSGSSRVFDRGFVTYSNQAKMDMLSVKPETLEEFGAVSEEVAKEMAEGAMNRSRAHIAVSVTGVAGPGSSHNKPEGRVCFGVAIAGAPTRTETIEFGALGRNKVREATKEEALKLIIKATRKSR